MLEFTEKDGLVPAPATRTGYHARTSSKSNDQGGNRHAIAMDIPASRSDRGVGGTLGPDLDFGGSASQFVSGGSTRPGHGSVTANPSGILPKD
jgi:hypothetical protein